MSSVCLLKIQMNTIVSLDRCRMPVFGPVPARIVFMTSRNPIECRPTTGMHVVRGFTVYSFMFSCASVKMLIDNCVAPPPIATAVAATAIAAGGMSPGLPSRASWPCEYTLRDTPRLSRRASRSFDDNSLAKSSHEFPVFRKFSIYPNKS